MNANDALQTPFGAYLEAIFDATGWTPTEVARRAGLAPSTLTRPRNSAQHRFNPSFETLRKLAKAAPEVPVPPELTLGSKEAGISANILSEARGRRSAAPSDRQDSSSVGITVPSHLGGDANGRCEVPASFLSLLDAKVGDALVTRVEDGVLTIETVDNALRRVRASVRRFVPEGVSLVDELVAERRAEAANE